MASPASAAPPPWSPDPGQVGRVILYNADGTVKTSGALDQPLAAYAAADGSASLTLGTGIALTKIQLVAANPSSSLPTGSWATDPFSGSDTFPNAAAPYPITGPGFTNPVNAIAQDGSEAVLSNSLAGFSPDSNPNYANKIQLRLTTANGTKWFASTVTINTAANTWTLSDPDVLATTTALTATPASPQTAASIGAAGVSTTFTAHVTRTVGGADQTGGQVQFTKNGVAFGAPVPVNASGIATTTDTPPNTQGASPTTYGANFVAGPVSSGSDPVVTGSSASIPYAVNDPLPLSNTALSLSASSVPQYTNVTFTATVTAQAGGAPATTGNVQFTVNGSNVGLPVAVDGSGVAQLTTNSFNFVAPGPTVNQIKAIFLGNASLAGSQSADLPLEVTQATCPGVGSVCSDPQVIQVKVNPGSLTISTPYHAGTPGVPANPFVLPDMTLNAVGTLLSSSGQFPAPGDGFITVTSTLSGDPIWTASAESTDLTGSVPGNVINGQNVGLTGLTLWNPTGSGHLPEFTHPVTLTDQAAAAGVPVADPGTAGLKGGPKQIAVTTGGGNGTAQIYGTMTVNAPTTTVADTYNGTVTFTVV